jgi:beta-N-acetylhexosaminidase
MSLPKAGIFGLSGLVLSDEEKRFFAEVNPLGFILFTRNCDNPAQVKRLVFALKTLLARDDLLILIDQEGGRVARLKPPHWRNVPAAGVFADIAHRSLAEGQRAVYMNARLIARELYELGINVDCAPLADVPVPGAHDIISDRAYGDEPHQVCLLAEAMARGLTDGGALPVLKHIPGHGRARADSHEELPVVNLPADVLETSDFIPFKALAHLPLGMTAHILYTAIDPKFPATLSPSAIRLIREDIGFEGLLMSDDISMKALKGDLDALTQKSLAAGCDLVLHCNGKMEEMRAVASALVTLNDKAQERFAYALTQLKPPKDFNYAEAEQYLAKVTGN